jgi:hypothetical protein
MKKHLLIILFSLFSLFSYSQISFEKGYFINNSDEKTDCLIKNEDWKNNPTNFLYKLSEESQVNLGDIKSVKEFGVYNFSKYIKSAVQIDRSKSDINNLSAEKKVTLNEELLFLKVLIEGQAQLFSYSDGGLKRYFFNLNNSNITPLIYKKYITSNNNQIGENNQFKQQILNSLACESITLNKLEKLEYKKNSLTELFVEYNECTNVVFKNYDEKEDYDAFNLNIRPRLNNSTLTITNSVSSNQNSTLKNETNIGFGIEAEYIFPFNKGKWATSIEPTFQGYKSQKTNYVADVTGGELTTNVDYTSIDFPISLKYFSYLNNNSKIFANISYNVFSLDLKSSIEYTREDNSTYKKIDITSGNYFAFGIGYKYRNKYSLELRFIPKREILKNNPSWGADYKTTSIIFGYTIF